jgi:hypothetical protein
LYRMLALPRQPGGRCIAKDKQEGLQRKAEGSDLVVFLSPVSFGQCSPIIKNAIDKGVSVRLGASVIAPVQFIVGYGMDADEEEKATFIDCVRKHQGGADIIHPELRRLRIEALVSSSEADNGAIAGLIEECLLGRETA